MSNISASRSFVIQGWPLLLAGALGFSVAGCAASTQTVEEPRLVPASRMLRADEQDPFRFVRDEAAEERAERREATRCEFRVESLPDGAAVDFRSAALEKHTLREQVSRAARVFNSYRSRERRASLEQLGSEAYEWRRLLELGPQASVVDTADGVRLVLRDVNRNNLLELRARVRWHAAGLLPDPALYGETASSDATECVFVPRVLAGNPG